MYELLLFSRYQQESLANAKVRDSSARMKVPSEEIYGKSMQQT